MITILYGYPKYIANLKRVNQIFFNLHKCNTKIVPSQHFNKSGLDITKEYTRRLISVVESIFIPHT